MIILVLSFYLLFALVAVVTYRKVFSTFIISTKKYDVIFLFFCFSLFLLAAFRQENSDKDYGSYLNMYNLLIEGKYFIIEPTFYIIVIIIKYIFNDPIFLFIIYAMLGVALKCKAIKILSEYCFLSLLVYLSYFFILHEMTQIRIGVSAGLMLLAIKPIYERDIKRFLCYALFSILFHYSAVLILFLWFMPKHSVNRWFYALLIPIVYLLYLVNITFTSLLRFIPIEIIQRKISIYIELTKDREMTINVFNVIQLFHCGLAYLFLWKLPLLKQRNHYIPILLQCYVWSIAILVIFSDLPVFAYRISEFLGCVEIILIPCILYIFKSKKIAVVFIEVKCLGFLFINIFYNKLVL
jgi:hypothetical protein